MYNDDDGRNAYHCAEESYSKVNFYVHARSGRSKNFATLINFKKNIWIKIESFPDQYATNLNFFICLFPYKYILQSLKGDTESLIKWKRF
jgi:hypothetical protein